MLKKLDNIINGFLSYLCIGLLLILFALLVMNVFFRFVPVYSMGWFDEIVEISFAYLTFFGAAYIWRLKEHSRIDFLSLKFQDTFKEVVLELIISLISVLFILFMVRYSLTLIDKTTAWSPIFRIPRKVFYSAIPISGVLMIIYSIRDIYQSIRKIIMTIESIQQ